MDKRKKENIRVKQSITNTLFSLMSTKSLNDIRISEIVKGANVARASFYRNYSSKEDVLVTLIQDLLDDLYEEINLDQGTIYTLENTIICFKHFEKYKGYILDLHHSGFFYVILDELNHFHESIEGHMPYTSIQKYEMYIYIGALLNTAITWLYDEHPVSCEEIAKYFYKKTSKMRK